MNKAPGTRRSWVGREAGRAFWGREGYCQGRKAQEVREKQQRLPLAEKTRGRLGVSLKP